METFKWKIPEDVEAYVRVVLAKEADDIPEEKIVAGKWILDEINIKSITVDRDMVASHDSDSLHIKRKTDFIESIRNGIPIYPLILLGKDLFLVDGYARYRALKELGVERVKVIRQSFDDEA